jgi:hypothetical protein
MAIEIGKQIARAEQGISRIGLPDKNNTGC